MKLTAKIKLQPTTEQYQALFETLETANNACNYVSEIAWDNQVFNRFKLHHLVYQDIKTRFALTAQVVIRCISKVADSYKTDKETRRTFKPHGAIAYDNRILRWYVDNQEISIWSVDGRLRVDFVCGKRQKELLKLRRGESDLCLINGEFYIFATCNIDEPIPDNVEDVLGVDLGIVNIATDSDGEQFSGSQVLSLRKRRRRQRKRMQKKGTKSAKRRLKKLSGKEQRFATDVNHVISKQIVEKAKRTNRAISLEDLKGIRQRIRARKSQRDNLHSWSFHQLGQFIIYKAKLAGVSVVFIDPAYTSQTCSICGFVDKANRKSQDSFLCISCGYASHADANAAKNISILGRAVVNQPNVSASFRD